jgi:hypothetical protein
MAAKLSSRALKALTRPDAGIVEEHEEGLAVKTVSQGMIETVRFELESQGKSTFQLLNTPILSANEVTSEQAL